ncbi:MCP four helix bundle domain-containing protein [Rhodoferax sp. AJA081-3]|uniref:MCP four helix bundle domain-containing protein n=1 Tax=Rhodoferax sp. AJA081-3 TaxID=2752316 RepID=UPI001ADF005C|nr:MCP four helix bundle domain-containing protein [Rhodoferax sp. AJA081-3]QTN29051.1 MCP four helix bundle domain-containing protein [Rhodoferax sp. AJA081-3]
MNAPRGMAQTMREAIDGLSVRASLGLAFACVVTGAVVIGGFSLYQMGRLNDSTRIIYDQEYTAGQAAEQVRGNVLRASRAQTQLLTASTPQEREGLGKDIETSLADADKKIAVIQGLSSSEESVATTKQLVEILAKWSKRLREYVKFVKEQPLSYLEMDVGVSLEDAGLLNETRKVEKIVDTLVAQRGQSAKATLQQTGEIYKTSVIWVIGIVLLLVAMSIAVGSWVIVRLLRQLGGEPAYAKSIANRIADGDLTMEITLAQNDTQSLLYSLHEMQVRLAERTEQLRQKTNDINAMLQNMPQGVLTVVKGGVIHPEYSAYMATIFETNDIADRPVMELVFGGSNLGADILSQIETTIDSVIGEDEMQYDFNSHLLVTDFDLTMPDGRVKAVALSWSPISDTSGVVDKLMLCVRDVTELKALAAEAGQQKRELDIIGQILAISQEKFSGFIDGSVEFLAENKKIIEDVGPTPQGALDPDTATQLFRNMHTVKGNARTYGLLHLTNMVHEAEQSYEELRQDPDAVWDQEKLLGELARASAAIEEYAHINKVKLGRTGPGRRAGVEKYLMVQKVDIQDALDLMDDSVRGNDLEAMRAAHLRVHNMLKMLGTVRVQEALEGIVESLPSLAKELSKESPIVSIDDHNIVLRTQIADLLKNVFMHLYRNSIDHGIEAPEKRLAKGKPAAGHINLDVSLADGRVVLKLGDDGAGLAVDLIRQRAIEKGLLGADQQASPEEIAQLIFAPGFSTAAVVTEVSGRGVGMDAVKSFVEREEGTIELVFRSADTDSSYRAFDTVISMPGKFAVQAIA